MNFMAKIGFSLHIKLLLQSGMKILNKENK